LQSLNRGLLVAGHVAELAGDLEGGATVRLGNIGVHLRNEDVARGGIFHTIEQLTKDPEARRDNAAG
jgi:hypothetical protein